MESITSIQNTHNSDLTAMKAKISADKNELKVAAQQTIEIIKEDVFDIAKIESALKRFNDTIKNTTKTNQQLAVPFIIDIITELFEILFHHKLYILSQDYLPISHPDQPNSTNTNPTYPALVTHAVIKTSNDFIVNEETIVNYIKKSIIMAYDNQAESTSISHEQLTQLDEYRKQLINKSSYKHSLATSIHLKKQQVTEKFLKDYQLPVREVQQLIEQLLPELHNTH